MRLLLQPCYVLHRRPFRDSSVMLEILSAEHGRLSLVARGLSRRRSGGTLGALLQPFRPLLLSFSGKGEMLTLTAAEAAGELAELRGNAMLSGLYLNELLVRLLHRFVTHPSLFIAYANALADMSLQRSIEPILRRFEFAVLDELGYGVDLLHAGDSGESIRSEQSYRLIPQQGFSALSSPMHADRTRVFSGRDLLAMAAGDFASADSHSAKRLVRLLVQPYLGDVPLRSRSMFAAPAAPADKPASVANTSKTRPSPHSDTVE
ncbi:MAG: DNA repair protein RecO [Congregibacter sp.]